MEVTRSDLKIIKRTFAFHGGIYIPYLYDTVQQYRSYLVLTVAGKLFCFHFILPGTLLKVFWIHCLFNSLLAASSKFNKRTSEWNFRWENDVLRSYLIVVYNFSHIKFTFFIPELTANFAFFKIHHRILFPPIFPLQSAAGMSLQSKVLNILCIIKVTVNYRYTVRPNNMLTVSVVWVYYLSYPADPQGVT